MSLEWKSYSLGDVASFKNGKKKVKTEGIYPVYGGNGISDYVSEFNSDGETIVIGRVGAYCGSVYKVTDKCWISDNAIECKIKDNYDFKYLFYLISSLKLNNYRIGSTQPLLTQDILNDISIVLPDLETQKKISEILNIIDKKIELNISINRNLHNIVDVIFKNFVNNYEDLDVVILSDNVNKIIRGFNSKYVDKSNLINLNQKVNKGIILEKEHCKYLNEDIERNLIN